MKTPSADALAAAESVQARLRRERAAAPVRNSFIERPTPSDDSPLALMIRGGRGGVVRLKLELSFLWFAAKHPHQLTYPARAWATLLDLPDPGGRGARRVNEAILWLEDRHFITVEQRTGQPNVITVLAETGTGEDYEPPGAAYNRLRKDPAAADAHRYVKLPSDFWTKGWLAVLSGPGVAMLLLLLHELSARDASTTDLWFSPRQASLRYGLSEDTRTKGLQELKKAGLVTARRQSISPDTFDFRRLRNVYRLHTDALSEPAAIPDATPDLLAKIPSFPPPPS